jgi:hypothetical protein
MLTTSDVRVYEDVLAVPSNKCFDPKQFLFDKDLNKINECGCFYNSFSGRSNKFFYTQEIPEPKEIIDSGIFGGWIWPYFSHFMMDTLSRLWYQKFVSDEKTYFFNVSPDSNWEDLYSGQQCINDFGNVFGFDPTNFKTINQPTLFKKLIIPDNSLLKNLKPTNIWFSFVNSCNWTPSNKTIYSKVYITRLNVRKNTDACLFGESGFIRFLEKEGFYILDVDKHSVSDQWFIINNADVVVIPEGSAILWSLFCSGNKMVIISRRPKRLCYGISDITDFDFANIAGNFVNTSIIDHVVGFIDSIDYTWANRSIFLNWKRISFDLKEIGLVGSIYRYDNSIRVDVEEYNKRYPFSLDVRNYIEKCLKIIGYRDT